MLLRSVPAFVMRRERVDPSKHWHLKVKGLQRSWAQNPSFYRWDNGGSRETDNLPTITCSLVAELNHPGLLIFFPPKHRSLATGLCSQNKITEDYKALSMGQARLQVLFQVDSFNSHNHPQGRHYYPHYTNEETEALRREVTCSAS